MNNQNISQVKPKYNLNEYNKKSIFEIEKVYYEAIKKINEKVINLQEWNISSSTYFLYEFFKTIQRDLYNVKNFNNLKAVFSYGINQKKYEVKYLQNNNDNFINDLIYKFYEKKHIDDLETDNLEFSYKLLSIIIDSLEEMKNKKAKKSENSKEEKESNKNYEIDFEKFLSEEINNSDLINKEEISAYISNRFRSFEENLIIRNYSDENEAIFLNIKDLTYPSSQIFYYELDEFFVVMAYSTSNEQYYNPKLPDFYKAPNITVFVFEDAQFIKNFLMENIEYITNLYRNFIQYEFLSFTNQSIINAMGETALIAQYWYTESINKILKPTFRT